MIKNDCNIDAVSSEGFDHEIAKVISPSGDDTLRAHEKVLTTADELAKGKLELEADEEEEDVEMERKFFDPPIIQ